VTLLFCRDAANAPCAHSMHCLGRSSEGEGCELGVDSEPATNGLLTCWGFL
jgi:hypothetical protein